jgi:hypothetical protein
MGFDEDPHRLEGESGDGFDGHILFCFVVAGRILCFRRFGFARVRVLSIEAVASQMSLLRTFEASPLPPISLFLRFGRGFPERSAGATLGGA